MKDLVIGDCHFGIKNNSVQWLEFQLEFFNKQIIPALESGEFNRVIFLGDLFDIRYAINQQVGYEVKNLIRNLSNDFLNIPFYIIAGNHDFYSPDINYQTYNTYNLLFGYEFLECHPNIHIVNIDCLIEDNTVFAPWYFTENPDKFKELMDVLKDHKEINLMYCHSDLSLWALDNRLEQKPEWLTVLSGHIHNAQQDKTNKLYNVGSMFPINFSDVNNAKYFYKFETNDCTFVEAYENTTTPKFIQFYNEQIFTLTPEDVKGCNVRIFINVDNINKAQYIERLTEIKKNYDYMSLKIQTVNNNIAEQLEGINLNTNIADFIQNNIPENLKHKYEYIKKLVEEKS